MKITKKIGRQAVKYLYQCEMETGNSDKFQDDYNRNRVYHTVCWMGWGEKMTSYDERYIYFTWKTKQYGDYNYHEVAMMMAMIIAMSGLTHEEIIAEAVLYRLTQGATDENQG